MPKMNQIFRIDHIGLMNQFQSISQKEKMNHLLWNQPNVLNERDVDELSHPR